LKPDPDKNHTFSGIEREILTYQYILKVIVCLVIPMTVVLLGWVIVRRIYGSITILSAILILNVAVLLIDRTDKPRNTKISINGILFKSQLVAMCIFLLYEIIAADRWELVPWTFMVSYLSFVLVSFRAGILTSVAVCIALFTAYQFMHPPEIIPTDKLMFRFFPSLFLTVVFFSCVEYIRNDYRSRLSNANRTLGKSKEKYQRLYEKLKAEVSERKHAQDELRGSKERFQMIAENVADVIWILDMELTFTYVSPSILQQRGYTVEEALQQSMDEVVMPGHIERLMSLMYERLSLLESEDHRGLDPVEFEVEQPCKDGSVILTSNHARFLMGPKGNATGIIGITRDITERRQTEEKLARSKKMESLGLLAGGVAHDLNNILSGIVSYPELLLMDLPPDSKLRAPIETIRASGLQAAAIVQDLLTVARGVAITKEPLNLNDVVQAYLESPEFDVLRQLRPSTTIDIRLGGNLIPISGSHVHLHKVAMNLVSNAAEAATEDGRVIITTESRYLDRTLAGYENIDIGEYAVLTISDNGPGIAAEHMDRIFEPFYTTKAMGRSGTGLGLSVVWNTVKDHKGYIDLYTDEESTTFEIYFPTTREAIATLGSSVSFEDCKGKGERILVVDDVESQRLISCQMLETLGYKAEAVSSGEKAVELLQTTPFDLILLDMIMEPGINGRQTFEKIVQIHPHQKAIIVSGFVKTEEVQKTQDLGAGKFLRKPLALKQLGAAIKEELKRHP